MNGTMQEQHSCESMRRKTEVMRGRRWKRSAFRGLRASVAGVVLFSAVLVLPNGPSASAAGLFENSRGLLDEIASKGAEIGSGLGDFDPGSIGNGSLVDAVDALHDAADALKTGVRAVGAVLQDIHAIDHVFGRSLELLDTRRFAVGIDGLPLGRILIRLDERYAAGATLHEIHIGDGGKCSPNELHGRCGWVVGRSIVRIRFAFEIGIAFVVVGCSIFGVVHSTIGDKDVFARLKDMMTFVGELEDLLDVLRFGGEHDNA